MFAKDLTSAISGWLCNVSWLLQLTASQAHPELHPRPPMQVAFGAYRGAAKLFLHLFPSVYVFVRLYTRRHLLALVSYRSLTIWSDDYSTPPYKPTVQCRTQTLQSHTQTVQTMEHRVHKLTIPSTLHHTHTISYIARYVQASYPVRSYIHWELNLNTRVYIGRPCFSREWHGKIGQGTDKTHLLTPPYLPKEMRHTSTYNGSDFSEAERIFGISDFYCCCSLLMTLTLSLSVS